MVFRSSRPSHVSLLAIALTLAGCPTPADPDGGVDTGAVEDTGNLPDVPRSDAGADGGADAGRETDCAGTDCDFVELELTAATTCARRENGDVICWGEGQEGQLGDGRMRHTPGCPVPGELAVDCSSRPVLVALDAPAVELSGGAFNFCAATGTTRAHFCWGERSYTIDETLPTIRYAPVAEPIFDGVTLDEAQSRVCWLDAGAVFCLGSNGVGQLGNGERMMSLLPVAATRASDMTPITGALEVEGGTFSGNTCARTATEVLCWGTNSAGHLGDGIDDHPDDCGDAASMVDCSLRAVPVTIDGSQVVDLGVGFDHACALMTDGTVRCWGGNSLGQLGLGNNASVSLPTAVPGVTGVAELSVNAYNTCVRLTDGRVQCWGQSNLGQVGDGVEVHDALTCSNDGRVVDCQLTPVFVMGLDDATHLGTGFSHSCAVRADNTIVCWGRNDRYHLGDGTRDARFAPVSVMGL